MKLFFEVLIWPLLVIALIELLFAQSQPHWFFVTLGFAVINVIVLAGYRLIIRRLRLRPS